MSVHDSEEQAFSKSRHDRGDVADTEPSLSALSVANSELTPGCGDSSDIVMSTSDATRAGDGSVYSSSASERAQDEVELPHLRAGDADAKAATNAAASQPHLIASVEEGGTRDQQWQHNTQRRRPEKKRHGLGSRAVTQHNAPNMDKATCDLDVFQLSAAPCLQSLVEVPCHEMTLADLWIFFEHGSLFGAPVHTAGSALGPSTAYFVPLLSAMRLFAVGEPESTQDHPSCGNSVDQHRYPVTSNGCAPARLLALFNNSKLPWDRAPMTQEIEGLSEQKPTASIPDPAALISTRLQHIHPSSWFAVWWQPVYRIPDMPLDAKFLAYYSFKSVFVDLHKRVSPLALHMPIAGMISSAVQPLPQVRGTPPAENWLQLRSPTLPAQELPPAVRARAERRLHQDLRELHAAAQQLTCDCSKEVAVLLPHERLLDELEHSDFTFLQRGRMGGSWS